MNTFSRKRLSFFIFSIGILLLASCQTLENTKEKERYNEVSISCDDEMTIISGTNILSVRIVKDPIISEISIIEIRFDSYAKELLRELTIKYLNKNITFFVKDKKLMTARVVEPILDGMIWISGYNIEEAKSIFELMQKTDS